MQLRTCCKSSVETGCSFIAAKVISLLLTSGFFFVCFLLLLFCFVCFCFLFSQSSAKVKSCCSKMHVCSCKSVFGRLQTCNVQQRNFAAAISPLVAATASGNRTPDPCLACRMPGVNGFVWSAQRMSTLPAVGCCCCVDQQVRYSAMDSRCALTVDGAWLLSVFVV